MTHSQDVLRLRNIEVEELRKKVQELEARIEVYESQLELFRLYENK